MIQQQQQQQRDVGIHQRVAADREIQLYQEDEQRYASRPPAPRNALGGLISFKLRVYTSTTKPEGAFEGDVFVILHGTAGRTAEMRLPSDQNSFSTHSVDDFLVVAKDVGRINCISVRLEHTATRDEMQQVLRQCWLLEKIRVYSEEACSGEGLDQTFMYRDWVKPALNIMMYQDTRTSVSSMSDIDLHPRSQQLRAPRGEDSHVSRVSYSSAATFSREMSREISHEFSEENVEYSLS